MARDVGDQVRLWCVALDEHGVQVEPETVTLTIRRPDGSRVTVTNEPIVSGDLLLARKALNRPTLTTVGARKAVVTLTQTGRWRYKWKTTGALAEIEQGSFLVRRDRVGNGG